MKNRDIDKKNESFRRQSSESEKNMEKIHDPGEKKLHQPNRPSV